MIESNAASHDDRRTCERYITSPMHHAISIRTFDEETFEHHGHAYDLSEGGVCFELDDTIAPGTLVGVMIHLPIGFDKGPGRAVFALGRIVWRAGSDEPGPVLMGAMFDSFARLGDLGRLQRFLNQGVYRGAAAAAA